MKPAPFAYVRPTSLEEALEALRADPGAKVLAGGQSLVPLLSMRLAQPSSLVDLGGVPDLDVLQVSDDGVRVGAMVRHSAVLAHPEVARVQPLVTQALSHVAHATIRNRGTTVGSIVHADPSGEMPMVLALLDGSVEALSDRGVRTVPAAELFVGPLETCLRHDEVATSAWFPALPVGGRTAFAEIARRHGDYALAGVGAVAADGRVRVGYLSVCDVPVVVDVTGATPEQAGDAALERLAPSDDVHATAEYRAHLVRVLTARVVREVTDD